MDGRVKPGHDDVNIIRRVDCGGAMIGSRQARDMNIEFKIIEVGSDWHLKEQALRDEVLRKPLGRALSATDIERDREGVHFVAVQGGEVVGCAGLYPQGDGVMRLRQMAVLPRLQRQSIGARLLSFAENWARDCAISRIETHARVVARGFYERCGYEAYGDVFEEISVPHIKMRRLLKVEPCA